MLQRLRIGAIPIYRSVPRVEKDTHAQFGDTLQALLPRNHAASMRSTHATLLFQSAACWRVANMSGASAARSHRDLSSVHASGPDSRALSETRICAQAEVQ